jgi:pSer/pThr/pTyr-binding forkhead associated (FHA) protein
MQMQLKVLSGNHVGKLIAVNHDKFLIGRADECHLRPKSDSISRRHCAILRKDGNILLVDLKSRNGTSVNDKMLDPAKAKILKDGDRIKIGKLEFIAVIEAGIANVKKDEVKSVKEAAERTASSVHDSRYEEFDVSSWLDEADQFERRGNEPDTRQFQFGTGDPSDTVMDVKAEGDTKAEAKAESKAEVPDKKKPGKLPPIPAKHAASSSKDAASETLRKFFGGGR